MINHMSRRSVEFEEFLATNGRRSSNADLFITLDKVWPDGNPPADDVARIFLRKPDAPFSTITDRGDWRDGTDLDVVRHRTIGPSRSTSM